MTVSHIAAFWSYTREDDKLDGGGIVELAQRVRNEFALVAGEDLTLFIDRSSISWGEEWRRRIDGALAETTFFIPIITPRYFTSYECRRELLEFSAQAQSLGISELILPIRYAPVGDFSEQNPDEAVALAARMQYFDWTQLRLMDTSSSEYRIAVNALATRLAEAATVVADIQLSEELQDAENPEDSELGIVELFDRINSILPDWIDSLDANEVERAQSHATWGVYAERIAKAERSGPASAQFALSQRLAIEQLPIAERALKTAQTFVARTIELDPLVLAAARIEAAHSEDRAIFDDLHSAVSRAHALIVASHKRDKNSGYILASEWTQERAHISRAMTRLARLFSLIDRTLEESNQIIERWSEDLKFLEST